MAMYVLFLLLAGSVTIKANQITRFCGIGYNLLKANPDAMNEGGVDPGYLPTRKIFVLDNSANPSQVELVQRDSCVNQTVVSMIYDERSYQRKFDNRVEVEMGVDSPLYSARFGLSTGFGEARNEVTTYHKVRMDKDSVCNYGRGRLKMALSPYGYLQLTQEFAAAVCALPESFNTFQYMRFLDRWGTHVTVQTDVGVRDTLKKTSSKTSFFQAVTSHTNIASSVSGSYGVVSGSVEIEMNTMRFDQTFQENFGEEEVWRRVGSRHRPEPIKVKLMTLDRVIHSHYWSSSFSNLGCPTDISGLRENIAQALNDYASYKGVAVEPSTGILRMQLTWPRGTYGLLKPRTRCPRNWMHGSRHFDSSNDGLFDYNSQNRFENTRVLSGLFDNDIRLEFCIKTQTGNNLDMDWPVGEYCILKYRSCPQGLSEGFIFWNDEDDINMNQLEGYLPDGEYGRNTKIKFCCRSDGNPTTPIFLPTSQPFVLIQASRYGCQQVANMRTTQVTVFFDTEGTRPDHSGGSHPYQPDRRNVELRFCHYQN